MFSDINLRVTLPQSHIGTYRASVHFQQPPSSTFQRKKTPNGFTAIVPSLHLPSHPSKSQLSFKGNFVKDKMNITAEELKALANRLYRREGNILPITTIHAIPVLRPSGKFLDTAFLIVSNNIKAHISWKSELSCDVDNLNMKKFEHLNDPRTPLTQDQLPLYLFSPTEAGKSIDQRVQLYSDGSSITGSAELPEDRGVIGLNVPRYGWKKITFDAGSYTFPVHLSDLVELQRGCQENGKPSCDLSMVFGAIKGSTLVLFGLSNDEQTHAITRKGNGKVVLLSHKSLPTPAPLKEYPSSSIKPIIERLATIKYPFYQLVLKSYSEIVHEQLTKHNFHLQEMSDEELKSFCAKIDVSQSTTHTDFAINYQKDPSFLRKVLMRNYHCQ